MAQSCRTLAERQGVSYLGYTGYDASPFAKATRDPKGLSRTRFCRFKVCLARFDDLGSDYFARVRRIAHRHGAI